MDSMIAFSGMLEILEPSSLFQIFELSQLTGKLELERDGDIASFYFHEGSLVHAKTGEKGKKLGTYLLERDWITKRELKKALKEFKKEGENRRVGQILVDLGYLDHDLLITVVQEQMMEAVFEALSWKDGVFRFFHDAMPDEEDILIDVSIDYLLIEGLRRMDESAFIASL